MILNHSLVAKWLQVQNIKILWTGISSYLSPSPNFRTIILYSKKVRTITQSHSLTVGDHFLEICKLFRQGPTCFPSMTGSSCFPQMCFWSLLRSGSPAFPLLCWVILTTSNYHHHQGLTGHFVFSHLVYIVCFLWIYKSMFTDHWYFLKQTLIKYWEFHV